MLDIRLRSKASKKYIESVAGKILGPGDVDAVITGAAKVTKPDGSPLLIYLPNAMPQELRADAYDILHTIRATTSNRGMASGGQRVVPKHLNADLDPGRKFRSYGIEVRSNIIGAMDATNAAPEHRQCRLTAWTGQHFEQWKELRPYIRAVADQFQRYVPDRYAAQMKQVAVTQPDWIIPGTPYSTLTVNNTYPTGVHTDKGDLREGFSCLTVLRRGDYRGGILTFPEYRVGVDLCDGDVILMDAGEWHGNTQLEMLSEDAERISTVLYYRTDMVNCATEQEEAQKANLRTPVS